MCVSQVDGLELSGMWVTKDASCVASRRFCGSLPSQYDADVMFAGTLVYVVGGTAKETLSVALQTYPFEMDHNNNGNHHNDMVAAKKYPWLLIHMKGLT